MDETRRTTAWIARSGIAGASLVLYASVAAAGEPKLEVPGIKATPPGAATSAPVAPGGAGLDSALQRKGLSESLRAAGNPQLRLQAMGLPSDVKIVRGQLHLTFNIGVANDGDTEGVYQLVGKVPGEQAPNPSSEYRVGGGETQRVRFSFLSDFTRPPDGERLPVTVVLQNAAGRQIASRTAHVELPSTPQHTLGRRTTGPDLAVSDVTVDVRRVNNAQNAAHVATYGLADSGGAMTTVSVVVANGGSERWGFRGDLAVRFHEGTPQAGLRPVDGAAGFRIDLPTGLESRQHATVQGGMPHALRPGYWYTVNVQLFADADNDAANNVASLVFFVEEDGRVTRRTQQNGAAGILGQLREQQRQAEETSAKGDSLAGAHEGRRRWVRSTSDLVMMSRG